MSSEIKKNLFLLIYAVTLISGFFIMSIDVSRDTKTKSMNTHDKSVRFICKKIDLNQ